MTIFCEIEASVCTGFELMAKEEIEELFGVNVVDVNVNRGRVNMTIDANDVKKVLELRSVDNLMVIVCRHNEFPFSDDQETALHQIRSFVPQVNWELALSVWSQLFHFPYPISASPKSEGTSVSEPTQALGDLSLSSSSCQTNAKTDASETDALSANRETNVESISNTSNPSIKPVATCNSDAETHTPDSCQPAEAADISSKSGRHCAPKNPELPSFRATCHRTGTRHSFQSPMAAAHFGGSMHNYFGWNVDLENYDIDVVLCIDDADVRIGVTLTRESLHRRDIAHFGSTTLRPTIAHGMLRMCKLVSGETVCDPMCGGGSIPIEAALSWPGVRNICGDVDNGAVQRALKNIEALNTKQVAKHRDPVKIDVYQWSAAALPLKDNSIDVFITDMPFGKRSGSRVSNWQLYPSVLRELARVSRLETGRACLLTHDRKCITKALGTVSHLWRRGPTVGVNIGGLVAGVYMLYRTSTLLQTAIESTSSGCTAQSKPTEQE